MARHNVMLFHHDGTRMGWVSRRRARHLLQTGKAITVCDDPSEIRFARPFLSKFDSPVSAREALKPEPSGDPQAWVTRSHAEHDCSVYLRGIVNDWGEQAALKKLIRKKPTSTTTPGRRGR